MALQDMLIQMLKGSMLTIELFLITLLFSIPLGFVLTLLYTGKSKILSRIAWFYILVMRGTPLLLQMFFIYYGLPSLLMLIDSPATHFLVKALTFDRFTACVVAFVLNYAAYFAEIFRGGLISVDQGQFEAAKVLGMSRFNTMRKIILPQMFRVSMPAISNEAIVLIKDTALVSVLAQADLLQVTQTIVNTTATVQPFAIAAVFYLVMSWVVTMVFKKLEKRFEY